MEFSVSHSAGICKTPRGESQPTGRGCSNYEIPLLQKSEKNQRFVRDSREVGDRAQSPDPPTASIRAVADAAAVSPSLVQHHFNTKTELQAAVEA